MIRSRLLSSKSAAENARQMLEAEISAEYLAEHTRRYAEAKAVALARTQSVVVFRIGDEWLALPTALFFEVSPPRRVHSVPHRERLVAGLVAVRGELVVCVSLAAALGLSGESAGGAAAARLAVIGGEEERIAFVADEIAGLHRYAESDLLPVPATLARAHAIHTRGLLSWNGHAVAVLDPDLLVPMLNRRLG